MKKILLCVCAAAVLALGLAACGGSSGGGGGGTSTTVTLTPGTAAKGTITTGSGNNTVNFNFPANAVSATTVATIAEVVEGSLPAPIKAFQLCPGNSYVTAFSIAVDTSITAFNVPIPIDGSVPTSFAAGTTFNLATSVVGGSGWVDVGTIVVGAGGVFTENIPSTTLPGIMGPGTYLVYTPDPNCNTTISNLGIALVANDGAGSTDGLQVIHLYDGAGNPLATPTLTMLAYSGASDLDGQALTPSGSQGILVDGGNTIRFFSGVQTGVPIASTTTLDVSAYGGDGDSVAIMPNGDEAVVSADSATQLLLVSGITAGAPVPAEIITTPNFRDGVVISNDGKVLLARGSSGLTVYAIAPISSTTGSLGGAVTHSFTQTADLAVLGSGFTMEDGRDGIASSPADSSRAVVIGSSTDSKSITLVTGLPNAPVAGAPLSLSGGTFTTADSVAITPDGKTAIVGGDDGIIMVSGVDTGTLAQVGTPFEPTYAGTGGNVKLGTVTTLGITLDGKYVVVCDQTNSSLLVMQITPTSFSDPVGILNGIAVPFNDQMVLH